MTDLTKMTKAELIAELEKQQAEAPKKVYLKLYRSSKPTGPHYYGYIDLKDIPEGAERLRVAMWKPDTQRTNKKGEAVVLSGEVQAG